MKAKLLFASSILLLISCKSSEFKMKRESVNRDVLEVMKEIIIQNDSKIHLTKQLIKFASGSDIVDKSTLKLIVENTNEMSEFNSELLDQQLSKERISKYFQKLNNQRLLLNELFENLDNYPDFSLNQNYASLLNAFESQNNRTTKLFNQYNTILEENYKYVKYSKFDVSQLQ